MGPSALSTSGKSQQLVACHDAYAHGSHPVRHARAWQYDGDQSTLEVVDSFSGEGEHDFVSRLHFAPGLEPTLSRSSDGSWVVRVAETDISIGVVGGRATECTLSDATVSSNYRVETRSRVLALAWRGSVDTRAVVTVRPGVQG